MPNQRSVNFYINSSSSLLNIKVLSWNDFLKILLEDIFFLKNIPLRLMTSSMLDLWILDFLIKLESIPIERASILLSGIKQAISVYLRWHASFDHLPLAVTEAQELWLRLVLSLRGFLEKNNYILLEQVAWRVESYNSILHVFSKITFMNFDIISPEIKHFIERASIPVEVVSIPVHNATLYKFSVTNELEELLCSLRYAYMSSLKNETTVIIVPDLVQKYDMVYEAIHQEFFSNLGSDFAKKQSSLIRVTGGVALGSVNVIIKLVESVKFLQKSFWSVQDFFTWLKFFEKEHLHGVNLLKKSLTLNTLLLSKNLIINICLSIDNYFLNSIAKLFSIDFKKKLCFEDALLLLQKIATQIFWPSVRVVNSEEYQAVEKFWQCCTQVLELEYFWLLLNYGKRGTFLDFWQLLFQLLQNTMFQSESSIDAMITISGLLEAVGIGYDNAWICGMGQMQWPQDVKANPYVDLLWQHQHFWPRVCVDRELNYSQEIINSLASTNKKTIVSWSRLYNDVEQDLSYSIEHAVELDFDYQEKSFEYGGCSNFVDDYRSSMDYDVVNNRFLDLYAKCPFLAYIDRLLTQHNTQIEIDISWQKLVGIIIHEVLADFWGKHIDSNKLHKIDIKSKLVEAISSSRTIQNLSLGMRNILTDFLLRLLLEWLNLEKARPNFRVVAIEQSHIFNYKNFNFKFRIDRIDKSLDAYYLIDYKTQNYDIGSWVKRDLLSSQIPLYSVVINEKFNLEATLVAQLKNNNLQYIGLGKNIDWAKLNKRFDFDAILSLWKQQLFSLLDGIETLIFQPKVGSYCQKCSLSSVCRQNFLESSH